MKISIVTVAYNNAATNGDTLASVLAQTHPDIEHVAVDGTSKDETVAVVHAQGRRVVRLLRCDPGGAGHTTLLTDRCGRVHRLATGPCRPQRQWSGRRVLGLAPCGDEKRRLNRLSSRGVFAGRPGHCE